MGVLSVWMRIISIKKSFLDILRGGWYGPRRIIEAYHCIRKDNELRHIISPETMFLVCLRISTKADYPGQGIPSVHRGYFWSAGDVVQSRVIWAHSDHWGVLSQQNYYFWCPLYFTQRRIISTKKSFLDKLSGGWYGLRRTIAQGKAMNWGISFGSRRIISLETMFLVSLRISTEEDDLCWPIPLRRTVEHQRSKVSGYTRWMICLGWCEDPGYLTRNI